MMKKGQLQNTFLTFQYSLWTPRVAQTKEEGSLVLAGYFWVEFLSSVTDP